MRLASLLLVGPTLLVALAPTFEVLVAARVLQGLCMPGLLVVGAPYVVEQLVPRVGARAMGWYVGALVLGGLVGRVGVALATGVVGLARGLRGADRPPARRGRRDARARGRATARPQQPSAWAAWSPSRSWR